MRRFMLLAVLAALSASAGAGEIGHIGKFRVYFDPKLVVGPGWTRDYGSGDRWTAHLGAGATLFSLDRQGLVGVLGPGVGLDFYDFQHHDGRIRDLSRATAGDDWGGGAALTIVPTVLVARAGPLAWHYSFSRGVESFGVKRGRLHFITFDVIGFIRLVNSQ